MAGFDTVNMLLIDNYDSFTYNVVQAFAALGASVTVHRNDAITVEAALELDPTHLVISPGPGRPEDAGVSLAMIDAFAERVPVLGICLGHQSLVHHFGGEIVRAERLMHGKTSTAKHDGKTIFEGLPPLLEVGRYHSLCALRESLPDVLELTAETDRGEVMGVRHKTLPLEGVQFHPESVLTPDGRQLMANFLRMTSTPSISH
jgi:anthranilate synthase component 2/para-aminobenzoate synthetase component 2